MAEERNIGVVKRNKSSDNDTKYTIDYLMDDSMAVLKGTDGTLQQLPAVFDTTNTVVEYNPTLQGFEVYAYGIRRDGTVVDPSGNVFRPDYLGSNTLSTYDLTWGASVTSPNTNAQYRKFTYNSATKIGIIHLDFTPNSNLRANTELCRLGSNMPKPITLIESGAYGSNGANGNIWVNTDGIIRTGALTSGNRYIVDLIGYFQ